MSECFAVVNKYNQPTERHSNKHKSNHIPHPTTRGTTATEEEEKQKAVSRHEKIFFLFSSLICVTSNKRSLP